MFTLSKSQIRTRRKGPVLLVGKFTTAPAFVQVACGHWQLHNGREDPWERRSTHDPPLPSVPEEYIYACLSFFIDAGIGMSDGVEKAKTSELDGDDADDTNLTG